LPTVKRLQKMTQVLNFRQSDLTVVCENIHDPHNVSAILRSCDAVGIPAVHLLYTSEKFPKLGRKSSASANKWIEIKKHKKHQELKQVLQELQMVIYATSLDSSAGNIYEIDWTKPSAIILGNEHRGVSDEALQIADQKIAIPMFGMVESLNVSVAAAVILYEVCRQRMQAGRYRIKKEEYWIKQHLERWIES
jgi:tRNA (guanosine-2'-O-)-methyltransferase